MNINANDEDPGHSIARATPPCPHFGVCGGCQLQDMTYSAQLEQKAVQLRASLAAAGLALPELQRHASPPLAYRNRIRLTLGEAAGRLRAGYLTASGDSRQTDAHRQPAFLPISQCPIAAPVLWQAAEALVALLNQRPEVWIARAPFMLDQLELFTTADETQLQISLFVRTSARSLPPRFDAELATLCEALRAEIPALIGAGMYLIPPRSASSRRVEQPRPGPMWGSPGLNYSVSLPAISSLPASGDQLTATTYWVPRGAFFQVNRFLLPELVEVVAGNPTSARTGALAWDLYAGVGLFTRVLAAHFACVTAVEIAEPAFTALASSKLPNRRAVKDTTLDFLRAAAVDRDRPNLVVLDPPRTGAGPEVCELLGRIAAPTLVYVSCSPQTLTADLATLTASGYTVSELHLFDLFPQTTHIETVAVLTR